MLNASTLVMGGALQVAVTLVREILHSKRGHEWVMVLSRQVFQELDKFNLDWSQVERYRITESPAKNRKARRQLKELERRIRPDVVFTVFGPSYVSFDSPHLCGVADGWVTHSNRLAFSTLGGRMSALLMFGAIIYKGYWFRKADSWVVEANNARYGLSRRLRLPYKEINIIPNNCGEHYMKIEADIRIPKPGEKVRLLCLSSYYKHKNLEIIPKVAKEIELRDMELDFEFVLTLPPEDEGWKSIKEKARDLGVESRIRNEGPVSVLDGPSLYQNCHIAFQPSLLETFSANYPEAMASQRPIVTTDLDFAHSICGDAAIYFEASNAAAAAHAVLELVDSNDRWVKLVEAGRRRLRVFPDSKARVDQYVSILEKIHNARQLPD